jgi:hypothetical protein
MLPQVWDMPSAVTAVRSKRIVGVLVEYSFIVPSLVAYHN